MLISMVVEPIGHAWHCAERGDGQQWRQPRWDVQVQHQLQQKAEAPAPASARSLFSPSQSQDDAPKTFFYPRFPLQQKHPSYGCVEGCSAYFLTHFHCVSLSILHKEHAIQGVNETLLEANRHRCPGAAFIHFSLPHGKYFLHTGDFRSSKPIQSYSPLVNHRVNLLYLDTTYCNPRYKFPSKEDVLSFVVRITNNYLKKQPKTLVVVGAYSIEKECLSCYFKSFRGMLVHSLI